MIEKYRNIRQQFNSYSPCACLLIAPSKYYNRLGLVEVTKNIYFFQTFIIADVADSAALYVCRAITN